MLPDNHAVDRLMTDIYLSKMLNIQKKLDMMPCNNVNEGREGDFLNRYVDFLSSALSSAPTEDNEYFTVHLFLNGREFGMNSKKSKVPLDLDVVLANKDNENPIVQCGKIAGYLNLDIKDIFNAYREWAIEKVK